MEEGYLSKTFLNGLKREFEQEEKVRLAKEMEQAQRQKNLTELANEFIALAKESGIEAEHNLNIRRHREGGSVMDFETTPLKAWRLDETPQLFCLFEFEERDKPESMGSTYLAENGQFYIYNTASDIHYGTYPLATDEGLYALRNVLGTIIVKSQIESEQSH